MVCPTSWQVTAYTAHQAGISKAQGPSQLPAHGAPEGSQVAAEPLRPGGTEGWDGALAVSSRLPAHGRRLPFLLVQGKCSGPQSAPNFT